MPPETPPHFPTFNPAWLTQAVRMQQSSADFHLCDWSVAPLTHVKLMETTGGLYSFRGHGEDSHGVRPWSLVLKMVHRPAGARHDASCLAPASWCYWKRELLAFQSGLLAKLPGPIRTPAWYGVHEQDGTGWIWMEQIPEATDREWSLVDFARAAHHLGAFAGAFLLGHPIPRYPWLSQSLFRSMYADGGWWAQHLAADTAESVWRNPLIEGAFAPDLRRRVLSLWRDKACFFDALDRLPQVFCHHDAHRRNLLWHRDKTWHRDKPGGEALVVLDWAFCGPGAVGMDLGELIATSAYFFDCELDRFADLEALERCAFDGYLAGLRRAGWCGDPRLVRLGYTACAALWMGASLPGWAATLLDPAAGFDIEAMCGRPAQEVLAGWVTLTEFLLDRADEARWLMGKLYRRVE